MKPRVKLQILLIFCALIFPAHALAATSQEHLPLLPQKVGKSFKKKARGKHFVFSKVGDSNSTIAQNIYSLSCSSPKLASYGYLRNTLRLYLGTRRPGTSQCSRNDSFARISAATRSGTSSVFYLSPVGSTSTDSRQYIWREPLCDRPGETYLACELRLARPRYTFITTGTNDWAYGLTPSGATKRYLHLVRAVVRNGSAPVLTTITSMQLFSGQFDQEKYVADMNRAIIRAGKISGTPVVNTWKAVHSLPDEGLGDGLHLSYAGDPLETTADFSPSALLHGANTRNLLLLRALYKLDKLVKK